MPITIIKLRDHYNAANHMEFFLDTDDDLAQLPGLEKCAIGSTAASAETGNRWILTSAGAWVEDLIHTGSGGGGGSVSNLSVKITSGTLNLRGENASIEDGKLIFDSEISGVLNFSSGSDDGGGGDGDGNLNVQVSNGYVEMDGDGVSYQNGYIVITDDSVGVDNSGFIEETVKQIDARLKELHVIK